MITAYLFSTGFIFIILGIIWTKKDIYNFIIKFFMISFGFSGIFLALMNMGFVIQQNVGNVRIY